MKTIITSILGIAAVAAFSACTTVEREPATHASTTTTSETTVNRPLTNTVETRTTRSY